ncbi:hypothetical protein Br6_04993 [Rhodococcus sp. Br-6]|nr:hypothetical protein Br6_04993 [Rhodococcus sp. Br-6]
MNGQTEPSAPASGPPARRRRWQVANIAVSVVLCGGAVAFGGYAALLTLFLPMITATCGPGECNTAVVYWAVLSGLAGIALILIAMCAVVVRSLIRRRRAMWWPLLAAAAIAALWILCLAVVSAAAGS